MNFIKKSFLYLILILLCSSIYHDLSFGSVPTDREENVHTTSKINSIRVQVLPGHTLLSIVENYSTVESLDIEEMINDFKKLNPSADPYSLEAYEYYAIPVYTKTGG